MSLVNSSGSTEKVTIDGKRVRRKINLISMALQLKKLSNHSVLIPGVTSSGHSTHSATNINENQIHLIGSTKNTSDGEVIHAIYKNSEWKKQPTTSVVASFDALSGILVYHNNEIHLLGMGTHYKWTGTDWVKLANTPISFEGGGACSFNGKLYVGGGSNNPGGAFYSWDGSTWTQMGNLPTVSGDTKHTDIILVTFENKIHLLAGVFQFSSTPYPSTSKQHWTYEGSKWTKLSNIPFESQSKDGVVLGNQLRVLGNDKSQWVYENEKWTKGADTFANGTAISAVVYENKMHMFGNNGEHYSFVTRYEEV